MFFPEYRPRRLRKNENIRSLVRETVLTVNDLIYPLFVCEGKGIKQEVKSMPEVYRFSIDKLIEEVKEVVDLGIKAVLLFGIPEKKDEIGSSAYAKDGIIQKALRALKEKFPELVVITDVCLCEYTSHGHCGIIKNHTVENDATLEQLAKIAVSHAKAGADVVAPSDMMDGRVGRIREALDEAGFSEVAIMSYAVKYCSAFYGPFREAADSAPKFGDRRSYQMDPANLREALREAYLDVQEGADILMVKPAMPYLDVIRAIREEFNHPLAAYQVSGEYAMIKAASKLGWLDEEKTMFESLIAIKRAGADLIITYFAKKVAQALA
ncbi:porphobilinogen synthase [Thermodesulfobacterium sp. TA1]|uniref:porphobilinogen synthase n=1 Tax=Thermodesulfobacterium sp. TA1 TaxID=2234087 RepID=UPI001231B0C7|nr:porphobilinogen synthase [Thermodesulfobacterium sp. TA1]QER41914.1 porphobilinogen synthase [Thermodesulfobacterium sp. TA1]